MSQRVFERSDQEVFARLSGDQNPLHMQSEWAAHVYPGQVVVHGMHLVLWLLDDLLPGHRPLARLAATFVRPVLLGDQVTGRLTTTGEEAVIFALVREKVVARIDVRFGQVRHALAVPRLTSAPTEARVHDLESLAAASGNVPTPAAAPLAAAFPRLTAVVGETALCGLTSLSTLVGMECPGLWSVFAELAVDFEPAEGALHYRVSDVDRRFSRATIQVTGCGLAGRVVAVVPENDSDVIDLEGIHGLVTPDEFAGMAPLLVGAGTGLGAVSALLLALGGARPIITVHRSVGSGERLRQLITFAGGTCDLLRLDVTDPARGLESLAELDWQGESLLYFASPRIFRRRIEVFQRTDFADFLDVYVSAFYELVRALVATRGHTPLRVFYPSSVAVDTQPPEMLEYALAKQAGEGLCRVLSSEFPSVSTLVERLPRTDTRQTRTFLRAEAAAPAEVMLPILRRLSS